MGWNDHIDDSELSNLPAEAFAGPSSPFGVDDDWLRAADPDDQRTAMREWFLVRFCDPAEETPYNGWEGGYLYIHGGPFDPADELPERFSDVVDAELIDEVVEELHDLHGDAWAPIRRDDIYDEEFGVEIDGSVEPLRRLVQRLSQSEQVLTLVGADNAKELARKLVYSSIITALESFLWETMVYWVDHDDEVVQNIVTKLPVFREQTISLGNIYDKQKSLKNDIKAYLQNIVWHRWDVVAPLLKYGLDIKLPSFKSFEEALNKRHDIVHRSGHTKKGIPVEVTDEDVRILSAAVSAFAHDVERLTMTRGDF